MMKVRVCRTFEQIWETAEICQDVNVMLREIAFKVLQIPGSSTPSERIFSKCGNFATKKKKSPPSFSQ